MKSLYLAAALAVMSTASHACWVAPKEANSVLNYQISEDGMAEIVRAAGRDANKLGCVFADPGQSFTPAPLNYSVLRLSGNKEMPITDLFQKHNGHYLMAIWIDPDTQDQEREYVQVQLGKVVPSIKIWQFTNQGFPVSFSTPTVSGGLGSIITLPVSSLLMVLEF